MTTSTAGRSQHVSDFWGLNSRKYCIYLFVEVLQTHQLLLREALNQTHVAPVCVVLIYIQISCYAKVRSHLFRPTWCPSRSALALRGMICRRLNTFLPLTLISLHYKQSHVDSEEETEPLGCFRLNDFRAETSVGVETRT